MNNRKNQRKPQSWEPPISPSTVPMATMPRSKLPFSAIVLGARYAEEDDGGRDGDGAAENHFGELVGRRRREAGQGDVVLPAQVGGVGLDGPHAHGQREEHLTGRRDPDSCVAQLVPLRIPDEVQAVGRRGGRLRQRQDSNEEDDGKEEEQWHAIERQLLDAASDAARQDPAEEDHRQDEEEDRHPAADAGRGLNVLVVGEEAAHALRPGLQVVAETEVLARDAEEAEPEHPGGDVGVVDEDDQRHDHAQDAQVLRPLPLPVGEHVEHPGHRAVAVPSSEPPHAPFDPHQRDAEQDERDEVRDHERPAAVLRRLNREAEEVAETDGVARHGEHEADPRAPLLLYVLDAHSGLLACDGGSLRWNRGRLPSRRRRCQEDAQRRRQGGPGAAQWLPGRSPRESFSLS